MAYVVGILVILVGLTISVGWHELGHLIPAKIFKVRVAQYMIGFGPTLWSRRKGETEYGVKALPLGGYIRMIGMYRPTPSKKPKKDGWATQVAAEAREASIEEMEPGDENRAFYKLSIPKRLVIMLGGPTMNLILFVILVAVIYCGIGMASTTNTIDQVSTCLPNATSSDGTCKPDAPASPAEQAGFHSGDTIVSWNGVPTSTWTDVTEQIRSSGSSPVPVVVDRGGQDVTLTVTPELVTEDKVDSSGKTITDSSGKAETEQVPYIGITSKVERVHMPISQVPAASWNMIVQTADVFVQLPQELVQTVDSMVTGTPRSTSSPVSVVGVARMAGDVTNADLSTSATVAGWLSIVASLNLALWMFNLLPLLPLDGGHVAGAIWEALRRGWSRLRHRQDLGPVDTARAMPLAYAVMAVLILMTVVLVVADIFDPISLT